jgi:16S rRNA (guanine527-N7)-methyltransferase
VFHVKHGPATQLIARAAALGFDLSTEQSGRLVALVDRLLLEPQNLTAIDDVSQAVDRHLADSLAGLAMPELSGPNVLDLGSGGGFPGLVIGMMRPQIAVTLLESERRKCEWLTKASADLPNVRVVADRSESLAMRERESYATVTARAVAPLVPTIELAAPLVAVGGHLLIWTSESAAHDGEGAQAAALVGFAAAVAHRVEPFPGAHRRILVLQKRSPTSGRYPRRPGRATTRPLVQSESGTATR